MYDIWNMIRYVVGYARFIKALRIITISEPTQWLRLVIVLHLIVWQEIMVGVGSETRV